MKAFLKRAKDYLLLKTPARRIEKQEHYGVLVWTHVEMDARRKTECLCRLCERCNPGQEQHCKTASDLYQICFNTEVALSVTRCPHFSPNPDGGVGAWAKPKDRLTAPFSV